MIYACQADKDVYVEKPMANSIEECNLMVKAAKRYNKVVQVGQQQRSGEHWINAMNYLHEGHLGRIRSAKAWSFAFWKDAVPKVADAPVPKGVDYDMWLGPAPQRPFNQNRFHFTFRWYWDYAGGLMTDWGVHLIDMVLYGMNAKGPKSVMAAGGKYAFPDDAMQTPDTMNTIYEFDDFIMTWDHTIGIALGPYQRPHGVAFIGENGTMVIDRQGWEILPELDRKGKMTAYKTPNIPHQGKRGDSRLKHSQNFVDCIKSRETPICSVEIGANVAMNAHLGNIAYRLGKKVYWDDEKQSFINDPEAQKMVNVSYRTPWELPKI